MSDFLQEQLQNIELSYRYAINQRRRLNLHQTHQKWQNLTLIKTQLYKNIKSFIFQNQSTRVNNLTQISRNSQLKNKFINNYNLLLNYRVSLYLNFNKMQQGIEEPKNDLRQIIKEEDEVQFLKVNRYEIQQNAIFIDYDPQQLIKTIADYPNLKYYHRVSLSKNIQAIEQIIKQNRIIHGLMLQIAKDHEDIQKQLIQFYRTCYIIHKKPKRNDYKEYLFNPLMTLIRGKHLQIKQDANRILTSLKGWLTPEEKKKIIQIAIQMSRGNDEENKIVSIQLIVQMTPDLSHSQNEKFFLEQYTKLYNDSSVRVKKQIITQLRVLGQNVTPYFFQHEMLDNFYLQKCHQKVWGVRKACVQIISQLVKITENRKEALANALLSFTKDGNKIVKVSAFKVIPEFLANYQAQTMPVRLMEIYLKLIDHEINGLVSRENQILNKVAFFFPGVLYRGGQKSWQQMRKLFERLIHHRNQEVKKPIASSLHQIGFIIGPELSKQYMFTALDTILKDKSDHLKLNAINHISEFVKLFDTVTRENLIDVFLVLQKDPKKWRVRYSIAHQLPDLSKIYETQAVFKYIFPISLKLCNDNVYEVRTQASKQIYHVINSLKSIQIYEQMAIQSIKGFGVSQKFVQRQTFSSMIQNLYKLPMFEQKFIGLIEELAQDPIIIVRIALAISINKAIKQSPQTKDKFQIIVNKLRTNYEVAEYLFQENQ